jgi:glycerate 2-kinase
MTNLVETARTIFKQALAGCSVEQAMARHISVRNGQLYIDGEAIDLNQWRRIRIVAAGKAASPMLQALLQHLPASADIETTGIIIAPLPPSPLPAGFRYFCGGHPLPNEQSCAAARAALKTARAAAQDSQHTLCLFLISGGASAMMELPLDPEITLADTAAFHRVLIASGAPIAEMNCVRKHFSAVKGGRLALAAGNALRKSLLISDVPADRQDALSSGPTVPDSSTMDECRYILERYQLLPQFPAAVRRFFESAFPETPKPEELQAHTCTLLDSHNLAEEAARHAEALGYTAVIDNTCDEWEYREAAQYLLNRLRILRKQHARICLVSAGEVIVALPSVSVGTGGRNQQFALYAATLLGPQDGAVAILSAGSDGIDGNSPAAGAVLDAITIAHAKSDALKSLANFDAHSYLSARNATITTGPSGNNLRDLRILLADSPALSPVLP